MIDPIWLMLLLVAGGIVLLIGELLLPTHGVLGLLGLACLAAAVGACFYINQWLGMVVLFAVIVVSPFIINGAVKLWSRSPVGKKLILQPIEPPRRAFAVRLGDVGTAVSELRPMGECEFGDQRIEVISQLGIIPPGRKVKVVAFSEGKPAVRAVEMNVDSETA